METKESVKGLLLEELWELCYRAHTWTSFNPERRATQYVREYSEVLQNDLNELGENQGNYKEKFIQKFSDWMGSKSNCASSMITGGSNFNVRRNEKALNAEHNKSVQFSEFRERYFKAVNRTRTLSPEEELDNALNEHDIVSNNQEMMKEMNKVIKKMAKDDFIMAELIEKLRVDEYPERMITEGLNTGWWGIGFAPFMLTNNNAKIKRLKDKILVMKNRINTKVGFEDVKFEGGYITIENDRVKIFHETKPEQSVIQELKSNGFRWSPNWKCWCRKHTSNALFVAQRLSFVR